MTRLLLLGFFLASAVGAPTFVRAAGEADVLTTQVQEDGSSISWGRAVGVIDQPLTDVVIESFTVELAS